MLGQHMAKPLARAIGPARHDHPLSALPQFAHMRDRRLEHVDAFVLGSGVKSRPIRPPQSITSDASGAASKGVSRPTGLAASVLGELLRRQVEAVGL